MEARVIIDSLLRNPSAVTVAIKASLRYLRTASRRFGTDSNIDYLAGAVLRASNSVTDDMLRDGANVDGCFELLTGCKLVSDGYRDKARAYGSEYIADRCRCLFNLAECLRVRSRLADCIKLLKECEFLLTSNQALDVPLSTEGPSIGTVCPCLAEALLLNGEAALAGKKARCAIRFL